MINVSGPAKLLMTHIQWFSRMVVGLPLRRYQLEPLKAVLKSVLEKRGLEFLIIFPRQSGKNEAVAQLLAYLLNIYRVEGGNIIYGAVGDQIGMGRERLEGRLDNAWNLGEWGKRTKPARTCLGEASVTFLSTHPSASARGQTAHLLLVVDEAQDQLASHIEAVFTPMRAAKNATALYIGTVKLTTDFLWQKKRELEAEERRDGERRVFMVTPEEVAAESRSYEDFLAAQVRKHGRHHPIVASEYYLEPIDGSGGLFDERRLRLMKGSHARLSEPQPGQLYVATLDVAGEDEAATDPIAQLDNPGRDYTVATVFQVEFPAPGTYAPGPTYRAVDVFIDHGSKHFGWEPVGAGDVARPKPADGSGSQHVARSGDRHRQEAEDRPQHEGGDRLRPEVSLTSRLLHWFNHWHVAHIVADESGVGQGLVSWLKAALGAHRVTGYGFGGGKKAALGSAFLALVETGRFRYWQGDDGRPLADGWWFWRQVEACTYEIPPEGVFDRHLRWWVPASHRTSTPLGLQPTHDDRLLSAALVAELDRMYRTGGLTLGLGRSRVIGGSDPLGGDVY